MKKILFLMLFSLLFSACKDPEKVDPKLTPIELIALNQWQLEKYASENGQTIANSALNTEALFLYAMNFEFRANGEVRGVDKTTKNIVSKGVWSFLDNDSSINVQLPGLDYDFSILLLEKGKLTMQAPTGNFLSGVGEKVNLVFTAVSQ